MKKFAKISAMLAAMLLAFAFSGCSDGSSGGSSDDSSEINGGGTSGGSNTSGGETSGSGTSSGGSGRDENGQLIAYSITYNLDGGTNAADNPASYTIEDSITLKTPTKDGFVFLGWYTDSEFENKVTEIAKGSTGDVTLYTRWRNSADFVKVPAASITGSETWTPDSEVFVSGRRLEIKSFLMSDHEVTQAEWKDVMGSIPSYMANVDGKEDNNPVNDVSWYDALVYCNKRSIEEGLTPCYTISGSTAPENWGAVPTRNSAAWNKAECDFTANGYRLPTDAEWEWAARGGENYKYAGSDEIDDVAWYAKYVYEYDDTGTREVKTKKANGYELYDMSGNVWEWCWDWWRENIPSDTPAAGVLSGSLRSLRGGSWCNYDSICSVNSRGIKDPSEGDYVTGFRVVRSVQ